MAEEIWTIKRCLDWTLGYLKSHGDERPRLSAEWLLCGVTGMGRTDLYLNYDRPLSREELSRMHEAVVRRAKGEPLQYIVGRTSFRAVELACEPGVLIPRPETELLVEEVLAYLDREVLGGAPVRERVELPWNDEVECARREEERRRAEEAAGKAGAPEDKADAVPGPESVELPADGAGSDIDAGASLIDGGTATAEGAPSAQAKGGALSKAPAPESPPRTARVLEVGCGTGCISCSLAHERPGRVKIVATDIEPRAVALASRNRDELGIPAENLDIRLGNLVSPLDREREWGTFDALVSNPPYIPTSVMGALPREVADFEPALALDGGADGLDIFRRLVNAAPHMLRPGGLLACELYEGHLDQAAEICRTAGMGDVRIVRDLTTRPRIILATVG